MSLETSIEVLAGALSAHAEALKTLAAAIQAAPTAANCERFEAKRLAAAKNAAEKEAEALTTETPKKAQNKAAKAAKPQNDKDAPAKEESAPESQKTAAAPIEAVKDWEAGGGADIEKGIPVKPGEDPFNPPFEDSEAAKDLPTAKKETAPVAERAESSKKSEEKTEQPQRTLESARQVASSILKKKGADKLRSLLDEVGVKKLSALNAEQINAFCANAEKALAEA